MPMIQLKLKYKKNLAMLRVELEDKMEQNAFGIQVVFAFYC